MTAHTKDRHAPADAVAALRFRAVADARGLAAALVDMLDYDGKVIAEFDTELAPPEILVALGCEERRHGLFSGEASLARFNSWPSDLTEGAAFILWHHLYTQAVAVPSRSHRVQTFEERCLGMAAEVMPGETHGRTRSTEHNSWRGMVSRCQSKTDISYHKYGGRGIQVCERWANSYAAFLCDMGRKPGPEYSLDRINNDGNYEPSNCRWATPKQQSRNTRTSRLISAFGETKTLVEWAQERGICEGTIHYRLSIGVPPEDALTIPPLKPEETRAGVMAKVQADGMAALGDQRIHTREELAAAVACACETDVPAAIAEVDREHLLALLQRRDDQLSVIAAACRTLLGDLGHAESVRGAVEMIGRVAEGEEAP